MSKRLILTGHDEFYDYGVIEKKVKGLNYKLKGESPFTDFEIKLKRVIDVSDCSGEYSTPDLLREIANRIELGNEFEIKPWID